MLRWRCWFCRKSFYQNFRCYNWLWCLNQNNVEIISCLCTRLDNLYNIHNIIYWFQVYSGLSKASNCRVYKRDELPERYHYKRHKRAAPIIVLADLGWMMGPVGSVNSCDVISSSWRYRPVGGFPCKGSGMRKTCPCHFIILPTMVTPYVKNHPDMIGWLRKYEKRPGGSFGDE